MTNAYIPTRPGRMPRGSEGWTTPGNIHPATGTLAYQAPIYNSRDDVCCVLVSKDINGNYHIWGDQTWAYSPTPIQGVLAQMHLTHHADNIDLAAEFEFGISDWRWGS